MISWSLEEMIKQEDIIGKRKQTDNMHIQYKSCGHICNRNCTHQYTDTQTYTHTHAPTHTPTHRSILWRSGVIFFLDFRVSRRRAEC